MVLLLMQQHIYIIESRVWINALIISSEQKQLNKIPNFTDGEIKVVCI